MAQKNVEYPLNGPFYSLSRSATNLLFRTFFDIQVKNPCHLDLMVLAPAIFAFAPHEGHPDTKFAYVALSLLNINNVVALAKAQYWFNNDVAPKFANAFIPSVPYPTNNIGQLRRTTQKIHNLINEGTSILVAPEGTRTQIPGLPMEERAIHAGGSIDLAMATGRPIIPIFLSGHVGILDRDKWWKNIRIFDGRHRRRVTVTLGDPILFPKEACPDKNKALQTLRQRFVMMAGEAR